MSDETTVSSIRRLPVKAQAQNLPGHVHEVLLEAILTRVLLYGYVLISAANPHSSVGNRELFQPAAG